MKSLVATLVAIPILFITTGCTGTDRPDRNEPNRFDESSGVTFFLDAHDSTDTTISLPVDLILTASPLDPTWEQSFQDPDTLVTYQLRPNEPITVSKHTPYGAPIYFPINQVIDFTVTIKFFGGYGIVGICAFKDLDGVEIPRTRQTFGIYDQLLRSSSIMEGPGEVTCTYTAGL